MKQCTYCTSFVYVDIFYKSAHQCLYQVCYGMASNSKIGEKYLVGMYTLETEVEPLFKVCRLTILKLPEYLRNETVIQLVLMN